MNFLDSIKVCFQKFVTFKGRASRSEYWYFMLFLFIAAFFSAILDLLIFGTNDKSVGPFGIIFYLIAFLPSTSVCVRRLHDVGKSGWLIAIGMLLLPFLTIIALTWVPDWIAPENTGSTNDNVGSIVLILSGLIVILFIGYSIYGFYLTVIPGDSGVNKYGENPLNFILNTKNITTKSTNNFELLERLHELHQKGILTEDEYNQRKNSILGSNLDPITIDNTMIQAGSLSQVKTNTDLDTVREIDEQIKKGQLTTEEAVAAKGKILGTILTGSTEVKAGTNASNNTNQKKTCIKCNNLTMKTMIVCPKCGSKEFSS